MAEYFTRRVTVTRHEWVIPRATYRGGGAAVAELYKALAAAEAAYRAMTGKEPVYDDWFRMWAADEEIILWFEHEGLS